jgi:cold shock CspA family protein
MQLTGILRSWNDERGFGFISPTQGGPELFVHVSAFPRDGSRPVEGESLTYELGRGGNGRPQAVRVVRQAVGTYRPSPKRISSRSGGTSALRVVAISLLAVVCAAYVYRHVAKSASPLRSASPVAAAATPPPALGTYRCDGRTHCSQMTSCAEASYFLKNCPGVRMDGNNDGIPCEQQWCK